MEVTAFLSAAKARPLVIAFSTGRKVWVGRGSTVDQTYLDTFSLQTSCLGSGFCFGKRWCLVDVASLKRV